MIQIEQRQWTMYRQYFCYDYDQFNNKVALYDYFFMDLEDGRFWSHSLSSGVDPSSHFFSQLKYGSHAWRYYEE